MPTVNITALPDSAGIANRILRLPASVAGKTLCLAGTTAPAPLCDLVLALQTTNNLAEGSTNKYYTDARVGAYLLANYAMVLSLGKPVVAISSDNTITGYTTFQDALIASTVSVVLNANAVNVTGTSRYFPNFLDGRGSYVTIAAGAKAQLPNPYTRDLCYICNTFFAGPGQLTMLGATSSSPKGITEAGMLENCTATMPLELDLGNSLLGLMNCHIPSITGTGTVYLFGNTAYPTTVGAGVTIIDRRPGSGFLPNVSAEPATPVGSGITYVQAGQLKYKGTSGTVTILAPA